MAKLSSYSDLPTTLPRSAWYPLVRSGQNYKAYLPVAISVDAYDTIAAAIAAAQSCQATLLFTPGQTYTYTPAASGAAQIASPLHIVAYGATIKATAAASYTSVDLFNAQTSDLLVEGGTWDWNSTTATTCYLFKVGDSNSGTTRTNIEFRNATFQNAYWGCLELENSQCLVDNCRFLNNHFGDINAAMAGSNVDCIVVRDSYFECPATNYEAINILNLSGATKTLKNIMIVGNTIKGSLAPSVESCAIQVWANSSNYLPGPVVIANNNVTGFKIGISNAFSTNSAVTGNTVIGSTLIGFEMAGSGIACAGNTCDGKSSTQYAFTFDGAANNNFSGNHAREFILYGYSVTNSGSSDVSLNGCHAYQTAVGAISAFAIFGVNGVTLSGCHSNMPNSTGGLGVYAVDVGNLTITGCSFKMASGTLGHVYLDNSTGTTRDNIKIKSNTYVGTVTPGNVNLIGTSYGRNVDVEGLASAAQTQSASKSTAITSTRAFQIDITMNGAALAAGAAVSFNWPNTFVAATDTVSFSHVSGGTIGAYVANGVCSNDNVSVTLTNVSTASKSEAVVLRCVLTKSKAA